MTCRAVRLLSFVSFPTHDGGFCRSHHRHPKRTDKIYCKRFGNGHPCDELTTNDWRPGHWICWVLAHFQALWNENTLHQRLKAIFLGSVWSPFKIIFAVLRSHQRTLFANLLGLPLASTTGYCVLLCGSGQCICFCLGSQNYITL